MGKRIIPQRRGRGGIYATPNHRYKAGKAGVRHPRVRAQQTGDVLDLLHDPGRTAPLALVRLQDGSEHHIIAPEGVAVGDAIELLSENVEPGNVMKLRNIPEGTPVFNVESQPGDGGKFVRSAGTNAVLVGQGPKKVTVRLPSGVFKSFHPACRATVGVVAGGGHQDKPFVKAGKKHHAYRARGKLFPKVSGVAKNPVDHPHGGGNKQHVGTGMPGRNAPPGRKVGSVAARRTGKR